MVELVFLIVFEGRVLYPSLRHALLLGSFFLVGCNGLPVVPETDVETSLESTSEEKQTTNTALTSEPVANEAVAKVVVEEQSTGVEDPDKIVQQPSQVVEPVVVATSSAATRVVKTTVSAGIILSPAAASSSLVVAPRQDMQPTNRVALWLAQAALAMDKDQLTTPANNNAYAYYARILMLDENNPQALKGLERIVQRYLVLAKSADKKGKAKQAKLFLSRANKVVPGHAQVAAVGKQLAAAPVQTASRKTAKTKQKQPLALTKYKPIQTHEQSLLDAPDGMQRQRILLPKGALKNEASALAIYLRSLARQIEQVDGRLYIIAPRDKEVRWVYSLLNGTNPDYRIRANIKHKSPAAIEVMYKSDAPILDVFH